MQRKLTQPGKSTRLQLRKQCHYKKKKRNPRLSDEVRRQVLGFPKLPGPDMDAALVKGYFFRVQVSVWGLSSPFSSTEHPGERLPGLLHGP